MKLRFVSFLVLAAFAQAQQTAPRTVKGLTAAQGLEVTLWASEPQLVNPTNIDIDARGRVWVLEGVNYRRQLRGEKDIRPNGDRITILEDTDRDGKADHVKVFDQNIGLRSPLGIAVLGDKVIVSQSPDLIVYTKDEDDRIVKREVLLTGWKGVDHDHGLHSIVFGHDGLWYFNSGDPGFDVTDRSGKRFVSARSGPFYAGTALRTKPDGTGFTVLGHNFRNPYELALDSFGNIWQTDNDDDGNAWTRVNYVMQGGNFGYWGPGGRSWREDKGSHFHSELPGVVPNIARTGAGSPCGLLVYEGSLLPERYRGHLLHAEAGKRFINAYFLSPDGAGFSMKTENTVTASDTWFRPSDVTVAPDGAVYISDWYDPSVGGHQMKDIDRGRIYRLAPPGHKPTVPKVDLTSAAGLMAALRSPAQSVRYLAYMRMADRDATAREAIEGMLRGDAVSRARALWLAGEPEARKTLADPDPNFRILAIRVLERAGADIVAATRPLLRDASPQVRREIAVSLREVEGDAAVESLLELTKQYDGKDRWYLEALGIGARGKENALYARLRQAYPEWSPMLSQLLWEFRPSDALSYLKENPRERMEPLAAMASAEAGRAVAELVTAEANEQAFTHLGRRLFGEWTELRKDPAVVTAIRKALATPSLQRRALELADDLEDPQYGPELLAMSRSNSAAEELRGAALQALGKTRNPEYLPEFESVLKSGPLPLRVIAVRAIGYTRTEGLEAEFRKLILSSAPNEVRSEAVRVLGRGDRGMTVLLDLEQSGKLPAELRNLATSVVHSSRNPEIRRRADKLLPPFAAKNRRPLPPPRELLSREGDARRGRTVFVSTSGPKCNSCHAAGDGKRAAGPDLADIGAKLGKDALLDSILNPSAGIAHEYYQWILDTKTQGQVIGILAEDTPQRVVVRTETGEEIRLKPSEITARRRSKLSMMPEDLVNQMTEQQLVDLLEYLTTLKKNL